MIDRTGSVHQVNAEHWLHTFLCEGTIAALLTPTNNEQLRSSHAFLNWYRDFEILV